MDLGGCARPPLGGSDCFRNPKFHFAHPLKLNHRSATDTGAVVQKCSVKRCYANSQETPPPLTLAAFAYKG